ncbi:hypothetical protein FOB72_17220 (plasmid) [Cupriavidus pauculus]|uniref:Uncharacterized protein n=1 Tax=Cupriavidus pauculus TaxID=82633 RepID=A0A5P2H9W2_9BURK|nr:hypothetical protein [Cupriavidus pauculus]QET03910.1 hypothetical protein FOB72_17220 [Cupriavidus pauculus]
MTIADRVDDARFLRAAGRPVASLAMYMIAVAASSRRRFPLKSPSVAEPTKTMGDGEAFRLFIGGRLNDILFLRRNRGTVGESGVSVAWKGEQRDVAWLLYKYYRNGLLHDGALDMNAQFASGGARGTLDITVKSDTVAFGEGLLDLLDLSVVDARCNGEEFGRQHYDWSVRSGRTLEDELRHLARAIGVSIGSVYMMSYVLYANRGIDIDSEPAPGIWTRARGSDQVNGGVVTGLKAAGLVDMRGDTLTDRGIEVLREMSRHLEIVAVRI